MGSESCLHQVELIRLPLCLMRCLCIMKLELLLVLFAICKINQLFELLLPAEIVTASTNASGAYSMTVLSGVHSVTASHPNYASVTHSGIIVVTG